MSFVRLLLAGSLVAVLAGCGSNGLGGVLGGLNPTECDTGTQVQLASPSPSQSGVNPNIGQIIIVASGNSNNLYNTYSQWQLQLFDQFNGSVITSGNLSLVPDPNGPHPFTSDFYYAASVPQLPSGVSWNAQIIEPSGNCSAVPINSFST